MFKAFQILVLCGLIACTAPVKKNAKMDAFDSFIKKEKFVEDRSMLYPGISDPALKPVLTEKVNAAAEDFRQASHKTHPTEQDYLAALDKGLSRFDRYTPFDTEDRERVGHYFEELMDMVGLKSSHGRLNAFLYGFDTDQPLPSR